MKRTEYWVAGLMTVIGSTRREWTKVRQFPTRRKAKEALRRDYGGRRDCAVFEYQMVETRRELYRGTVGDV